MRMDNFTCLPGIALAFGLFLAMGPAPALAQAAAPPAGDPTPAPASPGAGAASSAPAGSGSIPPLGVPNDSSAVTLELTPRPVAYASASAEWANGFKSVVSEIAKVTAAIKKTGLVQAGHPFALFLATDDKSFQFDSMVPITAKP